MGFFDNLWDGIKSVGRDIGNAIADGAKYVGKKIQKAGEWIDKTISNLGKKGDGPTIDKPKEEKKTNNNGLNEEWRKKKTEEENELIHKYQVQIEKRAKSREKAVKMAFKKIYEPYLASFEEVFDDSIMEDIHEFIEEKSLSFANTLRDEVNTKVNSSNKRWKYLISNNPSREDLQNYCDKIYTNADNNLLDLLQSCIEDTNKFISGCIVKYNNDKATALTKLKDSLIKLTADEETKAQELKEIAEELVVAQFIINETSTEV